MFAFRHTLARDAKEILPLFSLGAAVHGHDDFIDHHCCQREQKRDESSKNFAINIITCIEKKKHHRVVCSHFWRKLKCEQSVTTRVTHSCDVNDVIEVYNVILCDNFPRSTSFRERPHTVRDESNPFSPLSAFFNDKESIQRSHQSNRQGPFIPLSLYIQN